MEKQGLWNWTKAAIGLRHIRSALQILVVTHLTIFYDDLQPSQLNRTCKCTAATVLPLHSTTYNCSKTKCPCSKSTTKRTRCPTCSDIYGRLVEEMCPWDNSVIPMLRNCKIENWSNNMWEVAKAFIPGFGYREIDSPDATDVSGMINICLNAEFIRKRLYQSDLDALDKVRGIRNKVFHSSTLDLSDDDLESHLQAMSNILDDHLATSDNIKEAFKTAKQSLQMLPTKSLCEHCLEAVDCSRDALKSINLEASQLAEKLDQAQEDDDTVEIQKKLAEIVTCQNVHSMRISNHKQTMDKIIETISSLQTDLETTVKIRKQLRGMKNITEPTLNEALIREVKVYCHQQLPLHPRDDKDPDTGDQEHDEIRDAGDVDEVSVAGASQQSSIEATTTTQQRNTLEKDSKDTELMSTQATVADKSTHKESEIAKRVTDSNKTVTEGSAEKNRRFGYTDIRDYTENNDDNKSKSDYSKIDSDPTENPGYEGDLNDQAEHTSITQLNDQPTAPEHPFDHDNNDGGTGATSADVPLLTLKKNFDIQGLNFVTGMSQLTPTVVVTASYISVKLSLVDLSVGNITSSIKLPGEAFDVTTVSNDKVAVTMPGEQAFLVLSIVEASPDEYTMGESKKIEIMGQGYGIDYRNGKLAVTYMKDGELGDEYKAGVAVMDMDGKVEHDIICNGKNKIRGYRGYAMFAPSGREVFVTCKDDAVRRISLIGEVLASYRDSELLDPSGLAMTAHGELLVCGGGNNTLHVVEKDGGMRSVLFDWVGGNRPESLCLCENSGKLCVGMECKLAVFNVNRKK